MTARPSSLLERPDRAGDDALAEVFRAVRFTRTIYYTVNAARPWPAICVADGTAIAPGLGPQTRTVLSYHVLLEGTCWTRLETGEPVQLDPGDVIVYPRGDAYVLSPDREQACRPLQPDTAQLVGLLQAVANGMAPARVSVGPADAEQTRFVCGFLGCDPRPFDPLLLALPRMLVVKCAEGRLAHLVALALAEVDDAGAAPVRERLSESMFIETVRRHVATLAPDQSGWLGGLRDPVVGRALALLHRELARPWTLASLADASGVSRSSLADRFAKLVGRPPMQYLTTWRMQVATHLLATSTQKIAVIAVEVGYDSEAAFSRAFKKATGMGPAAWRAR